MVAALSFPVPVFFDSDVMIAGSASTRGASFVLLQLAELGLIKGAISRQVLEECRRNLVAKLPDAAIPFEQIAARCVTVYGDSAFEAFKSRASDQADPKDASILAAAIGVRARFLVTFNVKDYWPKPTTPITVLGPADLLDRIRSALSRMDT